MQMAPLSGDQKHDALLAPSVSAGQSNNSGLSTNSSRRDVLVSLNGRSTSTRSYLADQPDQSGKKSAELAREDGENGSCLQTNGNFRQAAASLDTPTRRQQHERPKGSLAGRSCQCSHKSAPELLDRHAQPLDCVWCSIAKSHSLASSRLSRRMCCTCCCGSIQPQQVDSASSGQPR